MVATRRVASALAAAWLTAGCGWTIPPVRDARSGEDGSSADAPADVQVDAPSDTAADTSTNACAPDLVRCGSTCVNTAVDPDHCGSCGHACPRASGSRALCVGAECRTQPECPAGYGDCIEPGIACVSVATDERCGSCAMGLHACDPVGGYLCRSIPTLTQESNHCCRAVARCDGACPVGETCVHSGDFDLCCRP